MCPHTYVCVGGIHTYVSFHACVCVTDYGNSCTNSASILFSISSGRAGKKSISVLFLYAVYCYHIFLQWLMSGAVGENKSYGLRIFLIIYQYDFIESMGDCHFIVANSFGAFSIIYRSAGNIHGSIFFLPIGVTFPPGHSSRRGSDSDFADKCCSYKKILPWLVCSISYRRQGPCVPGRILILYNLPYMLWLHVRPGRARIYLFALLFLFVSFLVSSHATHCGVL